MDSIPPTYTYVLLGVLGLLTAVYFFSYKRVYGAANHPPSGSKLKKLERDREIPTVTATGKAKKKKPPKATPVSKKQQEEGESEEAQELDARVTSYNPYASLEQQQQQQQQQQLQQRQVKQAKEEEAPISSKGKRKNKKTKSTPAQQDSPQLVTTFQQHVETETVEQDQQTLTQVDVTEVVDRDITTRQTVVQESQLIAVPPPPANGKEVGKKKGGKKKKAAAATASAAPKEVFKQVILPESEPEVVQPAVQVVAASTTVREEVVITGAPVVEGGGGSENEGMTPVSGGKRRRRRGKKGGGQDEEETPTMDITERSTHTTETTTITHGVPVTALMIGEEANTELAKLQEQTLAYENRIRQLEMMSLVMEKENSRLQQQYSQALQAKTEEEVLRLQLERKVRNYEEQEEQLKYTNRVLFEQLSEAKDRERERLRQMETKGVTLSVS